MVTPLDQDLNLDQEGLQRLVEHLIAGGVHGIFLLGTTGEAPNLPYDVRFALIEQTCKLARTRVPVIVGITDTSHKDAIRTAAKSYECGALAVVAAPGADVHNGVGLAWPVGDDARPCLPDVLRWRERGIEDGG